MNGRAWLFLAISGGTIPVAHAQRAFPRFPGPRCASPTLSHAATAIADMNNDGRLDVLVAGTSVDVMLGDGHDGFTLHPTAPGSMGASQAIAVWVARFDGDNVLDAAFEIAGQNSISIRLGLGGGDIASGGVDLAVQSPQGTAIGDVDFDGFADVVVAHTPPSGPSGIVLFFGDGAGGFSAPLHVPVGAYPVFPCISDVDDDGDGDVVVPDLSNANLHVCLQTAPRVFAASTNVSAPSIHHVQAFDFDGDQLPELVYTSGTALSVHRATGPATWGPAASYAYTGSALDPIFIADVDGFSAFDIAIATSTGLVVLPGDGAGNFAPGWRIAAGSGLNALAVADVDADGTRDLLLGFSRSTGSGAEVVLNLAPGSFDAALTFPLAAQAETLAIADFDLDGRLDVVVGKGSSNRITRYLGNGFGGFGAATEHVAGASPRGIATGDFDEDGKADVVVANTLGNTIAFLHNNGASGFGPATFWATAASPSRIAVGRFDADAHLDLAVLSPNAENVSILLGNGDGTFVAPVTFGTGHSPRAIVVADVDLDGDLDLVVANQVLRIGVLLGDGNGGFGAVVPTFLNFNALALAVARIDGDAIPDVVVVGSGASVLRGVGNGTFTPLPAPAFAAVLALPLVSVAALDVDGDGKTDVLCGEDGAVAIASGNGAGGFGPVERYATVGDTQALLAVDLNADQRADVLALNGTANLLTVLRNQPAVPGMGTPYCTGDGFGPACPCANVAALGGGTGCANSTGLGARLQAYGVASVSSDTLVLIGTQMPDSPTLYFQGSADTGDFFGDGLRCAGGAVVRLGTEMNSLGTSQHPGVGDRALGLHGGITPGQLARYQAWYRNAASFCTAATFNLTNGLRVTWSP